MSKISAMTIGLILIFIGAQLFLVKSYLLTPTATQFVQSNFNSNTDIAVLDPRKRCWWPVFPGDVWWQREWFLVSRGDRESIGDLELPWPVVALLPNEQGCKPGRRRLSEQCYSTPGQFGSSSQFASAGSGGNLAGRQRFVPPRWIMWPALFLGAVFFLHGAALRS